MAGTHYFPGGDDICPHCGRVVRFVDPERSRLANSVGSPTINIVNNVRSTLVVIASKCPACKRNILAVFDRDPYSRDPSDDFQYLAYPRVKGRTVPAEVPAKIKEDFLEANEVLPISEKASAALSRRCLQSVLIDCGYNAENLSNGIDEAIKNLPSHLADNLDMVRNVGNFGAHAKKSTSTGEIIDVEPEEASSLLDLLSLLFDFYYHQPALAEAQRAKMNEKLKSVGKPPLKSR